METAQPEAMRLANALSSNTGHCGGPTMDKAAAELRRLHEENEFLKSILHKIGLIDAVKAKFKATGGAT